MSLTNHTNVKENGGENENLTDYLKSMFNKLNNDIDLKQSQHQQSSSLSTTTKNNSIEKEIVNNDENIKSISNTSNIDERNQKQSSIDKQYVINKNQQIIIDKNNNNVIVDVAVTDDHDNDCNKIKLNNENDTSNKINGCDSITRTTTNDSHNDTKDDDSTLSSKSPTFTLTTSLHSYEIENNNNNDHKQDIENNKELKNFVNDQISKHNQSKNFVDHNNNNNNNNNNEIIHNDDNVCDIGKQSKVQVPKEIHQNIDYNYNKNNDDDNVDKRIPLADELLEELKSKIPKPNYNNENDDKNLNTKSINDNVKKTNFAMKILNSTHKNGEHHILMSNNNIDNNNDNSLKTQRDKLPSKANTQSNGSLNYNYLNNKHTSTSSITSNESNTIEINRPMSMLELNDEIDQSIAQQYDNQSKIKNFRFESFRKERPRSKEHVQELVKFWDNTIIKSRQMKNNQDE